MTITPSHRPHSPRGFSLLELLVVMTIVSMLSIFTVVGFGSTSRADKVTRAGYGLAGVLEQARTYARAHNTYTWVGLTTAADGRLAAGVVASRSGENNRGSAGDLAPIGKLLFFDRITLLTPPESANRPENRRQLLSLNEAIRAFSIKDVTFDRYVIEFNPRGEARVSTQSLTRLLEIGLGSSDEKEAKNYFAIQISGLSGNVAVYRPE